MENKPAEQVLFTAAAGNETLTSGVTLLRLIPASFETTLRFVKNAAGDEVATLTLRPQEVQEKIISYWADHRQLPVTDRLKFVLDDIAQIARMSAEAEHATMLQVSFHDIADRIKPFMPHSGLRLIYDTPPRGRNWSIAQLSDDARIRLGETALYIDIVPIEIGEGAPLPAGARQAAFLAKLENYKSQLAEHDNPLVRDINADLQARVVDINRALLSRDLGGDANGEEEEATIKREGYAGSYMASKEALIEIPVSLADAIGGPEAVRAAAEMRREEQSRDNEGPQEGRERRPEEGRERGAGGGGEAAERTRRDTEAAAERTRGEQEAATERALRQREEETERAIRERDEATARAIEETRKADLDHAESLRAAHEKVQTIIGLIRAHGNNPLPTALIGAAEVLRRSILEHGEEALALQEAIAEHQAAAREALEIHEADNTLHDSAHEVQAEAQHRLDEAGEAHGPVSHSLGGYGELVEAAAAHAGYSAPHYADLHYGTSKFSTAKHPPKGEYAETEYPEKAEYAESEYPEKAEFGETPAGPGSEESQKAHAEALERQQEGPQEGAGTAEPREAVSYSEAPENRVTQAPDIEAQQEQKAEQAREVLGAMQEERERDEERERQQERQHEDQREQEKKIREDAEKQSEERWERQDGREARVNEAAEVRQEAEDDRESRRDVILEHMAHLSNLPADAVGLRAMAGAGGTAAVQPFPEHAHPGGVYTPLQAAAGRSMPRAAPRAATVQAMTGGAAMLRGAPGLDAAKNFRTAANINTHWPGEWAPLGKTQFALGNFHAMPGINYKALGAVAAAQWPGAVPPKNDPVGKATKAILENNEASPRKNAKMKEPNFGHSFGDLLTPQEKPAPAPGPAPEPSAEG